MCSFEVPSWQPYVAIRVAPGSTPDGDDFERGWRICNKSSEPNVWVAYSVKEGSQWVRKGWRKIGSGTCSVILNNLNTRYVYYYAEGSNGGTWSGDTNLCIHPDSKFTIGQTQSCTSPHELAGFVEVDTGEYTAWTSNLVE